MWKAVAADTRQQNNGGSAILFGEGTKREPPRGTGRFNALI